MQPHNKNSSNGFLHNILVSGARPFRHRGRVNKLLGLPTENDQGGKPVINSKQAGLQNNFLFNASENKWPVNRSDRVYQAPVINLSEEYSGDAVINKKHAEQTEPTENKAKVYSAEEKSVKNDLAEKEILTKEKITQSKEVSEKYTDASKPAEAYQVTSRVNDKSANIQNSASEEVHNHTVTAIESLNREKIENSHKEDFSSDIKPAVKPDIKPDSADNLKTQRESLYEDNKDEAAGINQFEYSIPGTNKKENNRYEFSVDSSILAKLNNETNTEAEDSVNKTGKLKSKVTQPEKQNKIKQAVKIKTKNSLSDSAVSENIVKLSTHSDKTGIKSPGLSIYSVNRNKPQIRINSQDKTHTGDLQSSTKDDRQLSIKHPAQMNQLHAIEQLERAVSRLQNKNIEKKSVASEDIKPTDKSNKVAPVVRQQVIIRQQHTVLNKSPAAFWERSYLSKIGIRHFK